MDIVALYINKIKGSNKRQKVDLTARLLSAIKRPVSMYPLARLLFPVVRLLRAASAAVVPSRGHATWFFAHRDVVSTSSQCPCNGTGAFAAAGSMHRA